MSLSDHELTFAGGETQEFQSVGRFIRIRDSSSPVFLSIDGRAEIKRERGESVDSGRDSVRVQVRSIVAQSVHLISSKDKQDDNRASISATISTTIAGANDNQHLPKVSIPAGSSALIAVANSARKFLRVSLLSTAVGYVLLGKSGVGATTGGTLEEGMVDYIETEGALYAYNPQAVAVDVYVLELNKI